MQTLSLWHRPQWQAAVFLGLWLGLGMLSKYSMLLFFPVLAMLFIQGRSTDRLIVLTIATAIAFVCVLPNLWWNAQHDFISLRFQLGHGFSGQGSMVGESRRIHPGATRVVHARFLLALDTGRPPPSSAAGSAATGRAFRLAALGHLCADRRFLARGSGLGGDGLSGGDAADLRLSIRIGAMPVVRVCDWRPGSPCCCICGDWGCSAATAYCSRDRI